MLQTFSPSPDPSLGLGVCRVNGLGFWVSGFGFRVLGLGFWAYGFGCRVLGLRFWV